MVERYTRMKMTGEPVWESHPGSTEGARRQHPAGG
ncbi:hypothetical protein HPL003_09615 [Paenibacillus terrae HPL-003]|uniref:Uncharacterized protein n=1 Tax=Paenibacillus terrae (strain HPL-003) TaxID=985665 RepID=G7W3S4_PAETH|nr:hypothetical protein HPL003_09615 [Paenibacillus terrae HPL-003]